MNRPVVSVVVPTRNRPVELGEALASITAQLSLDAGEVEAIVVNDGGEPIDRILDAAREQGLPVIGLQHPRRLGLPSARNTGLDRAAGAAVALLDDDDVFLPEHLATALTALESGGVEGVATGCLVTEQRVDPTGPVTGAVAWDVDFDPRLLEVCNLFPVHTAVFRRPESARFDPGLPAIEDWDFWLRLTRQHDYRFARVPSPTVVYHRVPQAASMISAVADDARAMAEFSGLVRRIWSRWPTTTARTASLRLHSGILYWQVLGRLAAGQAVNPHYYLYFLQVLARAWRTGDVAGLVEEIPEVVKGAVDEPAA